jgi:hypothetical protein
MSGSFDPTLSTVYSQVVSAVRTAPFKELEAERPIRLRPSGRLHLGMWYSELNRTATLVGTSTVR